MTYTKKMIKRICEEVSRWTVPPSCQGQHVEYSYGFAANTVCVRSYDKTDRSESYGIMPDVDIETCEPWNREPQGNIIWETSMDNEDNDEALQRGIERLDAECQADGTYIYFAEEAEEYYVVTKGEVVTLGQGLINNDDNEGDDRVEVYSLWCQMTGARVDTRGWQKNSQVEAGDIFEDYDVGEIVDIRCLGGVAEAHIAWGNGDRNWRTFEGLRNVGEDVPSPD